MNPNDFIFFSQSDDVSKYIVGFDPHRWISSADCSNLQMFLYQRGNNQASVIIKSMKWQCNGERAKRNLMRWWAAMIDLPFVNLMGLWMSISRSLVNWWTYSTASTLSYTQFAIPKNITMIEASITIDEHKITKHYTFMNPIHEVAAWFRRRTMMSVQITMNHRIHSIIQEANRPSLYSILFKLLSPLENSAVLGRDSGWYHY